MRAENEQWVRFFFTLIGGSNNCIHFKVGLNNILQTILSKLLFSIEIFLSIFELKLFDVEN